MKKKNEFNNLRRVYFLIGVILILLAILLIVSNLFLFNEPITEKEVKCYDKYSNEIIGEKCIKIHNPKDSFGFVCALSFYLVLFGIGIIVTQIRLVKEEREYE